MLWKARGNTVVGNVLSRPASPTSPSASAGDPPTLGQLLLRQHVHDVGAADLETLAPCEGSREGPATGRRRPLDLARDRHETPAAGDYDRPAGPASRRRTCPTPPRPRPSPRRRARAVDVDAIAVPEPPTASAVGATTARRDGRRSPSGWRRRAGAAGRRGRPRRRGDGDGGGHAPDRASGRSAGRCRQFVVSAATATAPDDPIVHPGTPGLPPARLLRQPHHRRRLDARPLLASRPTCARRDRRRTGRRGCRRRGPVMPARACLLPGRHRGWIRPVVPYPAGLMMVAGMTPPTASRSGGWSCGPGGARPGAAACPTARPTPPRGDVPRLLGRRAPRQRRPPRPRRLQRRGRLPRHHPVPCRSSLASIRYPLGRARPGWPRSVASAHADFVNAWDQTELKREVEVCLNRGLVCGISRTDNRTF